MGPKKGYANNMKMEQYNFFGKQPVRLCLIRMNVKGIPIIGLDSYINGKGYMLMKPGGLITVVNARAPEMDISAAAMMLSDMSIAALATLIDKRIEWETINPLTVKAVFNDGSCTVSAVLNFNNKGELSHFSTEDKYYSPKGTSYQKVRWSTPVKNYKDFNGLRLGS